MAKVQLPVRIDPDTLKQLKKLAKADNRTLSNYVETVLKDHTTKKARK